MRELWLDNPPKKKAWVVIGGKSSGAVRREYTTKAGAWRGIKTLKRHHPGVGAWWTMRNNPKGRHTMATAKQRAWRRRFARLYGRNPRRRGGGVFVTRKGSRRKASRPRVIVSGGRFLLGDASPFRRRIHSVNPVLATYLNPRRHRMARRRYRRNPPSLDAILTHPTDVLMPGVVATGAMLGVVTVGNYVKQMFLSSFSLGGPTGDILVTAAVRGAVAWAGDEFLMKGSPHRTAYRIGAIVGVVGSAALDFMGKSFSLGVGDTMQTPQQLIGFGAYTRTGFAGTGAYTRARLGGAPGLGKVGRRAAGQDLYAVGGPIY